MIYTKLTNKAMKLAYDAHHGQLDINGVPYIFHPSEEDEEYSQPLKVPASACVSQGSYPDNNADMPDIHTLP